MFDQSPWHAVARALQHCGFKKTTRAKVCKKLELQCLGSRAIACQPISATARTVIRDSRARASIRAGARPSQPETMRPLIINHTGRLACDAASRFYINYLWKTQRSIPTLCPHHVRNSKEICDV